MNYCFHCGHKFNPTRTDQIFCSKRCRLKYYAELKKISKCIECGHTDCQYKKNYKGKYSPKDCPERVQKARVIMEVKNLEQASEMLKSIYNYLYPFSQRRSDSELENALVELDSLIEFCNKNEFTYVED